MAKRGKRIVATQKIVQKRKQDAKDIMGYLPDSERRLGGMKNKHPLDCGNPRCFCCHSDKLGKKKKLDEKRKDLDSKDQV